VSLDLSIRVNYASAGMNPRYLPIVDGLVLFALFVGAPSIAAVIGHAAWKGKPNSFDRERYGLSAVASGAAGAFLMTHAQLMRSDVKTPQYFLQLACFALAVVLLGVAGGCAVGIFVYRRSPRPGGRGGRSRGEL
jgi:hypothetical protein